MKEIVKETEWYKKLEEKFGEKVAHIMVIRLVSGFVAVFVFIFLPF